jgi:DNA-binding transcriptional regulator LsrR (DeoR family)
MTKVARLYHERGVLQPEIARRLHISQARVSRLLKQAEQEGIVRTTVVVPQGMWTTGVEDVLEEAYGLREAVVVECFDPTEEGIAYDLGVATATYLEASLTGGDVVGISSWSATLLAAVDSMRRLPRAGADRVIQLFGGVGNPSAEAHAARLTQRFADLTGAKPTFLLAPGIATSPEAREVLLQDQFVQEAVFDAAGRPVASDFDRRVIGVALAQLGGVDRSVGVAGGDRKYGAIRGALLGGWVNVLITDHLTAERLVADGPVVEPAVDGRQSPPRA